MSSPFAFAERSSVVAVTIHAVGSKRFIFHELHVVMADGTVAGGAGHRSMVFAKGKAGMQIVVKGEVGEACFALVAALTIVALGDLELFIVGIFVTVGAAGSLGWPMVFHQAVRLFDFSVARGAFNGAMSSAKRKSCPEVVIEFFGDLLKRDGAFAVTSLAAVPASNCLWQVRLIKRAFMGILMTGDATIYCVAVVI